MLPKLHALLPRPLSRTQQTRTTRRPGSWHPGRRICRRISPRRYLALRSSLLSRPIASNMPWMHHGQTAPCSRFQLSRMTSLKRDEVGVLKVLVTGWDSDTFWSLWRWTLIWALSFYAYSTSMALVCNVSKLCKAGQQHAGTILHSLKPLNTRLRNTSVTDERIIRVRM